MKEKPNSNDLSDFIPDKASLNKLSTFLGIIGRYILTPNIFNILQNLKPSKNGEIQITDALNEQAKAGQVLAYRFKGRRFDCGSIEGFVAATNYIYQQHYDVGENYPRP